MKSIIKLLAVLSLMTLTGCFDSSPSTSDVRKAIEARYPSCDYVSVENFKKINGIKVSENEYDVDVSYDVKISPVKDGEEVAKNAEDRMAKAQAEYDEIDAVHKKIIEEINASLRTPPNGIRYNSIDEAPEYKQIDAKYNIAKVEQQYKEAYAEVTAASKIGGAQGALAAIFVASCGSRSTSSSPLYSLGIASTNNEKEVYLKGASREFKATIHMIKSDNGWIMNQ